MGDRYLHTLLVLGVTAMMRRKTSGYGPWLTRLLARKPARQASVTLVNKMARIVWVVLTHGGDHRRSLQSTT